MKNMKLKEFVRDLVCDGVLVISVSNGEIVDYLISPSASRILIYRGSKGLSAHQLTGDDKIINLKNMKNSI